jgi:hypothetical protein
MNSMDKFFRTYVDRAVRAVMALVVATGLAAGASGCEATAANATMPPFSDITCKMGDGSPGHYEAGGVPICSIWDSAACSGKPEDCGIPSFGTCKGAKVESYACAPDRAEGTACVYAAQCGTRSCTSGICGQPTSPTPDLTTPAVTKAVAG